MSTKVIDEHSGQTTMGFTETVSADVQLVEDDQGNFEFQGDYQASGLISQSGNFGPIGPVTGDTSGNQDVGAGISMYYQINNWNQSNGQVSCELTVYLQGDAMGPD